MKKSFMKRASAALLAAAMIIPNALPQITSQIVLAKEETKETTVGSVKRAPQSADLEAAGNLDWFHACDKDQSKWAGAKKGLISSVNMSGTIAQIMTDTDTNFIYTGAPESNRKGQVINKIGGKSEFTLPARTEETYVSIFTGSWASQIKLSVFINDVEYYTNTHGSMSTDKGAKSYLTQFHYHTDSADDTVRVVIETVEVADTTYGNHSIQAVALSDAPQDFSDGTETEYATGVVEESPSRVNLTKQGDIDWLCMDSTDFAGFTRKNVPEGKLGEMNLIGKQDYVTTNHKTEFVYSDGSDTMLSKPGKHDALVFTGAGNGFSFSVPGSTTEQYLDIYAGCWAADIEVTMSVNGNEILKKSFGSSNTTAGSPAKYNVLRTNFHTDSDGDMVNVTVKVGKVYDQQSGNINIGAITLGSARVEDDGSIAGGKIKSAPAAANLSDQGLLDWVYFNNLDLSKVERKNTSTPLITNLTPGGTIQNQISKKTKTAFSWTDGTTEASTEDSHLAMVLEHEGSSMTMNLPASTTPRYVNVYAGAWAADGVIEILINDKVQYSTKFGSSNTTPDTTNYQMASLVYQTVSAEDTVSLRVRVTKAYDAKWGNINLSAVTLSDIEPANTDETIHNENWVVDHTGGNINALKTRIGGEMYDIPVRNDQYSGFGWRINGKRVSMNTVDADENGRIVYTGKYTANGADVAVNLEYKLNDEGQFIIEASLKNNKDEVQAIDQASLQMGFDTYLERYPDYNYQLFPTMMRCEKTHAWGYFSSPSGMLMTFATDAPVASYTLDYQSGQHRIYSASLDVLQSGDLPERHPQGLDHLEANEEKTWTIALQPAGELNAIDEIKPVIAKGTSVPVFDADRYTMADGEKSAITLRSASPIKDNVLYITAPDGKESTLEVTKASDGIYTASFDAAGKEAGAYKVVAINEAGYEAEMMLSIRNDWSWYIQKAREASVEARQKGSSHAETYYGFYSAYVARKYFPDAKWDEQVDDNWDEIYPLMYDMESGNPTSWENRIQNHSTTLGIFVDQYESSGNEEALAKAEHLADFLMSKQKADGGYYNGGTDYTSVIYPAKSIMELVHVEKRLMNDESLDADARAYYKERYDLHMESLTKAMDKLVRVDGNFDTEGQGTYEDGANSCSITQLSEFALMFPEGSAERKKYTDAAVKYMDRHTSHEQTQIPDSRMSGGTLRFWEAQYDVEMKLTSTAPNMMNSPHGWTAWNIYGLFNLYELTGNTDYLERGMNAMGSCAQLMGYDGKLNWAFIPDPQRKTGFFVKDEEKSHDDVIVGKHEQRTIGEQYVPMISYWWKAPKDTWVPGYTAMGGSVTQGACCDNDVHEVFKALGEVALTKAYVFEKEDGTFEAFNCSVLENDGKLVITPAEDVVSNVSVQLRSERTVDVSFYDGTKSQTIKTGAPQWISTKENAADLSDIDRNCDMASLDVKGGTLNEAFDPARTDYTINLPLNGGTVELTPAADGEKATIYYDREKLEPGQSISVTLDKPYEEQTVRIQVRSERNASSKTYTIRLVAYGSDESVDPATMTATAGSEHSTTGSEGPAKNVLDGNKGSIWHTKYNAATIPVEDRWIQLNLDEIREIKGVRVLPRQDSSDHGNLLKGKILLSSDGGQTWTEAASFDWANDREWKTVTFDAASANAIRIAPTETQGEWSSAAEIRVIAKANEHVTLDTALVKWLAGVAAEFNLDLFKDAGKEAFQNALSETNRLLENIENGNTDGIDQDTLNGSGANLNKAILDLRYKEDEELLQKLMNKAQ